MVEEPDSTVLRMLRDMRQALSVIQTTLDEHSAEFRSLHKKIDDWQETTATGVGLAAHANLRTQAIEQELTVLKERVARLEGRS